MTKNYFQQHRCGNGPQGTSTRAFALAQDGNSDGRHSSDAGIKGDTNQFLMVIALIDCEFSARNKSKT
jgi:hypothetical protein